MPFGPYKRISTVQVGARTITYDAQDPYQRMIEDFADAATGQSALRWGLPDAFLQAQVLDALLLSARSGQTVSLSHEALEA
ncbi:hypothetical protein [Deinococcus peraridilitoris]|uniref:hypothetical protein n=1 Tax=Deinococcus peraridilitoris TaxID=432329 RepID=UPI00030BB129|nr:hypothetical protein [Deinococcus peraridilitoris]